MSDLNLESLELHRRFQGKLATALSVPIDNKYDLSLAYTPGVAAVCREIAATPASVFSHTIKGRTIAVISDGSAILGLGNLGPAAALPVMEGKCALFKKFAGVDAFPLCLDTQDTEEIIKTIKYIAPVFGGINLEDIAAPRCFEIERRLQAELDIPVMHDDQHGTAAVVLAALINALKLRGGDKSLLKVVVSGAGAAGNAIVRLLHGYGLINITVCDRQGKIYRGRPDLDQEKAALVELIGAEGPASSLSEALLGADAFIGVSSAGLVTADMVRQMAPKALVFALANPIPEIMPEDAVAAGAFIVASGRSDYPNQINNVLIFPGIFLGALDNKVTQITDAMLVQAAENLAALVDDLRVDKILPDPFDERIAPAVAAAVSHFTKS
jgi:malate dehydrogenase (oxaloacetate-decarboxylating)